MPLGAQQWHGLCLGLGVLRSHNRAGAAGESAGCEGTARGSPGPQSFPPAAQPGASILTAGNLGPSTGEHLLLVGEGALLSC